MKQTALGGHARDVTRLTPIDAAELPVLSVTIAERNQAVTARDWLLAAVAHDLKNPLQDDRAQHRLLGPGAAAA